MAYSWDENEVRAYVQALKDAGVYNPDDAADDEYERFMEEMDLKEEMADAGCWLITVQKNYGTMFEREYLRVYVDKDKKISASIPKKAERNVEIKVGPSSIIRMFVNKLIEEDEMVKNRRDEVAEDEC